MNKAIQEREVTTLPGMLMVLLLLVFTAAAGWWVLVSLKNLINPILPIVALVFILFLWGGFFIVQPNQAAVLQPLRQVRRHGQGTTACAGPIRSTPRRVTLRVRNFESEQAQGQRPRRQPDRDRRGRRVAGASIPPKRSSTSTTTRDFVHVQSEAALRQMATSYPYDLHEEHKIALRSHSREINKHLKRRDPGAAGATPACTVLEARISHLAYAPEIAQAMLQRQQAARSSPRARASSKAPSAWCTWRSNARRRTASCSSTKSARPRWCRTCWWCCAASAARSRS